jgi:hypothetical protein
VSGTIPLGDIAKSVTPRSYLVSVLPSALLAAGVGILIASGAFAGVPSLHVLAGRFRGVNVFVASLLFLVVLAAALILYPFQLLRAGRQPCRRRRRSTAGPSARRHHPGSQRVAWRVQAAGGTTWPGGNHRGSCAASRPG